MSTKTERSSDLGSQAMRVWRAGMLNVILTAAAVIMILPLGVTVSQALQDASQWSAVVVFAVCYVLIVVLAVWRALDPTVRAWGLLVVAYGVSVLALARGGLAGDGRTYLTILPVLAIVLAGMWSGLVMTVLSIATFAAFALIANAGMMDAWLVIVDNSTALSDWVEVGTDFAAVLALIVLVLWRFLRFQERTLDTERQSTAELAETSTLLEEQTRALREANELLSERTAMLTIAAEVAGQIATCTDQGMLVDEFCALVSERLRIHDIRLFLREADGVAHLVGASMPNGKRMIAEGYGVPVRGVDAVSQAIRGEIEVRSSTTPESGEDRWRIVLPLQSRGHTQGAVDVYSDDEKPISQERLQALRTLVDQLAASLENAQLIEQVRASLEAERQARGELSREAWHRVIQSRQTTGYVRNVTGIAATEHLRPQVQRAILSGAVVRSEGNSTVLAMPITVRGQVIGAIEARVSARRDRWSEDQTALLATLTEQLGVALESARLYQDSLRRATQEQVIGAVTGRMRETLEPEVVLETAANEIREALGLDWLEVRLATPEMVGQARVEGGEGDAG